MAENEAAEVATPTAESVPQVDTTAGTQTASGRPEWLTEEKFWDADTGRIRDQEMYTSYRNIQGTLGKRLSELPVAQRQALIDAIPEETRSTWDTETRAKLAADEEFIKPLLEARLPKAPEKYELTPELVPVLDKLDLEDPVFVEAQDFARSKGLSNEDFAKLVNMGVSLFPAPMTPEEQENDIKARVGAMGEGFLARAEQTLTAARNALPANLKDGLGPLFGRIMQPAEFLAFEALVQSRGETKPADPRLNAVVQPLPTRDELRAKMNDERYWHPQKQERAYIDSVTALYQKVLGDEL